MAENECKYGKIAIVGGGRNVGKLMKQQIALLEELESYRAIGTLEECKEAVEKQKPKKPIIESWSPAICPNCGAELSESLGDGYYKHYKGLTFCECGQRLDWSEKK